MVSHDEAYRWCQARNMHQRASFIYDLRGLKHVETTEILICPDSTFTGSKVRWGGQVIAVIALKNLVQITIWQWNTQMETILDWEKWFNMISIAGSHLSVSHLEQLRRTLHTLQETYSQYLENMNQKDCLVAFLPLHPDSYLMHFRGFQTLDPVDGLISLISPWYYYFTGWNNQLVPFAILDPFHSDWLNYTLQQRHYRWWNHSKINGWILGWLVISNKHIWDDDDDDGGPEMSWLFAYGSWERWNHQAIGELWSKFCQISVNF